MNMPEASFAQPPPLLTPGANRESGSPKQALSFLLSLFLGLFLAAAAVSLADASLVLVAEVHLLTGLSAILSFFAALASVLVYVLMGLTPLIPKRLFIPLTLFTPVSILASFPLLTYFFGHLALIDWGLSFGQVGVGLLILGWAQGGCKLRWPLVPERRLGSRGFSAWNLTGFVLVNLLVLPPAVAVYCFICASAAVDHFTDGFMALRPGGFTVQVKKYVRADGKTIELFPMAHVADARFYRQVSETFPTNSIILMEGVTDVSNLLTNKLSYQRMAGTLGLSEQKKVFAPSRGEMVRADVDVGIFTPDTIQMLNLITLIHVRGVNLETVPQLLQFTPTPQLQNELFDDLLRKRNDHLFGEIRSHLSETDNLMIPWGVAHMPGIAKEIQKSGFRLEKTAEYMVIRFHGRGGQKSGAGQ